MVFAHPSEIDGNRPGQLGALNLTVLFVIEIAPGRCSPFLLPLVVLIGESSAHLEKFLFLKLELVARITGNGKNILKENRLFRANFFTESAINATKHIDLELAWSFFHMRGR